FDPERYPRRSFMADGTLRLVYAGPLSPTYELDVVLAAVARLRRLRPELPVGLDLYGRDYGEVPLPAIAARLGVADRVTFHGRIPFEAVPGALAAADVGLSPTRRNPFTDLSISTKLFEAAAMGKPVVASRLPLVERTFPPGSIVLYEPGDPDDLARAILGLVDDPAGRAARVERTLARARELAWEREAERYVDVVERLAVDGRRRPSGAVPPARTVG
ncbi:MAG TPA: glycosyltransferase, partial [Candidatus Limnocylindrales bacterium]|nr:glycosyltransferase [Candidatus Limnocylindrales bacterium]